MSVDKFGHFSNSDVLRRNVPKILGICVDSHNNLDIQNKKIKNLSPPSDDTDAVNKTYLQTQINHSQEILKRGLNTEIITIRKEIAELKTNLKDVYDVMITMASNNFKKE